jgi:ParB family transcriptional regulator, chromosome partitioning protein
MSQQSKFPLIKTAKVDDLIPYARNSRTHSDEQVSQIAASIKEFGFLNPVIVDGDNGIIAGHGRVMAAKKLGMTEVPAVEASHLTDAQRRAYIIADNKLALNAGWDDEMLRVEFDELGAMGFDLDLTGFSLDEIGAMEFDEGDEVGMPVLPDGDKEPFQQKTFTLHDEQAAIVDDAVTLARTSPLADTGLNENSNGNALALICHQWLEAQNG